MIMIFKMKKCSQFILLEVFFMKSVFYSAQEVAEILGVSRTKAYKIVKELNIELQAKGFIVIAGKIPKRYFEERCYAFSN